MDINSLMPSDAHKIEKAKTAGLVTKWAKTGLLEGVSNEYDKTGIAILLENQAKQLVTESSRTGTASNSEDLLPKPR